MTAAAPEAALTSDSDALLSTEALTKHFPTKDGAGVIHAVNGVSLTLRRGETVGVVGESGCGKSTFARLCLRLIEPTSGTLAFDGGDLRALSPAALRARRRDMQIVFQDPFASLDPRMRVGAIIREPLDIHGVGTRADREREVQALLARVGLPPDAAQRFPHEFSGGQRQRIGIARAIALRPKLLVLDEPVSALDVSIQAQILNLLAALKRELGLSYLFISHDLAVIRHISDHVAVMYLGQVVEFTDVETLYARPAHPYTEALISAIPQPDPSRRRQRIVLKGDLPSPESPPPGCPFHTRCPKAWDSCRTVVPADLDIGEPGRPHRVRCHLHDPALAATRPAG
ncbi:oligopeptide/dipeptide ABC transporter ATP-binding protein [Azospirillum sp. SYSU D00513]|uniref:ABC transporter ATP-binding protein n=1 Tax=Azospirillum sp. SYSU D00513 TaxID=2812561 RepID=UPI001A963EE7|nr:oligopeptide/dipeptide ABC transporter ATP-binding protein [Azospirillum sp. SYSU D00513]